MLRLGGKIGWMSGALPGDGVTGAGWKEVDQRGSRARCQDWEARVRTLALTLREIGWYESRSAGWGTRQVGGHRHCPGERDWWLAQSGQLAGEVSDFGHLLKAV